MPAALWGCAAPQRITKVCRIHPLGIVNAFSRNLWESTGGISLQSLSRPLLSLTCIWLDIHVEHTAYHHGDWHVSLRLPHAPTGRHRWVSVTWLPAKIKVETTPGADLGIHWTGSVASRETDRQMHRLTENDRMIEKSKNARECGGKGSGLTVETSVRFSVWWWMSDRCSLRALQRLIDADLCHLQSTHWRVCQGDGFLLLTTLISTMLFNVT